MIKNLKIGTRLAGAFGIILILIVALIVIGTVKMGDIQNNLERTVKVNIVRMEGANQMADSVREISIAIRNTLLEKSAEKKQEQKKRIEELRAECLFLKVLGSYPTSK